jgi:2-polyprenyl-3-methyl-5-hydroxy-6-metoxy-1,4-benzoquinol methylase
MTKTSQHPQGLLHLDDASDGLTRISVEPFDPAMPISHAPWDTRYPHELIEAILAVKGPAFVCDEIRREEDPKYVALTLRYAMLGYLAPSEFAGKRLLDFGCGCGSSTMILSRMLPDTEIVGVELLDEFLEIARQRAAFYGNDSLDFVVSPSGEELPAGIGTFDFIMLSAVFEHLLPRERTVVLEQIWSILKPGGVFFLNQTPYRFYPQEAHTTGLIGLNFLPDALAHKAARRYAARVDADTSWDALLRAGIRGGTEAEVVRILRAGGAGRPVVLEPRELGLGDKIDLWYAYSTGARRSWIKPIMRQAFRLLKLGTGKTFVPALDLAIAKR